MKMVNVIDAGCQIRGRSIRRIIFILVQEQYIPEKPVKLWRWV